MIDAHGLGAVLEALGTICAEKSEHVRASYGDTTLARMWANAGKVVDATAERRAVRLVTP